MNKVIIIIAYVNSLTQNSLGSGIYIYNVYIYTHIYDLLHGSA